MTAPRNSRDDAPVRNARTSVHRAVHRLKADGLLEVIPRKGILVRPDSLDKVLALPEAGLALEPGIAAPAAERVTPGQAAGFRALPAQSGRCTHRTGRITHRKHRQQRQVASLRRWIARGR